MDLIQIAVYKEAGGQTDKQQKDIGRAEQYRGNECLKITIHIDHNSSPEQILHHPEGAVQITLEEKCRTNQLKQRRRMIIVGGQPGILKGLKKCDGFKGAQVIEHHAEKIAEEKRDQKPKITIEHGCEEFSGTGNFLSGCEKAGDQKKPIQSNAAVIEKRERITEQDIHSRMKGKRNTDIQPESICIMGPENHHTKDKLQGIQVMQVFFFYSCYVHAVLLFSNTLI